MSDSELALVSNSSAVADLLCDKGFSGISTISTVAYPKLCFWDGDVCKRYLDDTGCGENVWRSFWTLAAEMDASLEDVRRVEMMLHFAWIDRLHQLFLDRFINRTDIWFQQWAANGKYGYRAIKEGNDDFVPINTNLIKKHLNGDLTISSPAISIEHKSRWCCWDNDTNDGALDRIASCLKALDFNPIREGGREGREGHLWLLFDYSIPCSSLIEFNRLILSECRIQPTKELEFFPKSATNLSQVRVPLGIHRKPGANNARGWFDISRKSVIMPLNKIPLRHQLTEQLAWLADQELNESVGLGRLVEYWKKVQPRQTNKRPPRQPTYRNERVNLIELLHLSSLTPKGGGKRYEIQCPACELEGGDKHEDNLHISTSNGEDFICRKGHSVKDILQVLNINTQPC